LSDIGSIYRTTSSIFDPTPIGPHELSPGPGGSLSLQILHDGTIVLVLDHPGNLEQPWAIAVHPKSIRPADSPLVFHPFDIAAPTSLSGFTSSPTVKYAAHDSSSHAAPSASPYSAALLFLDSDVQASSQPLSPYDITTKPFATEENLVEDTLAYRPAEDGGYWIFYFSLIVGILIIFVLDLATSKVRKLLRV
jgi:hypothetical protein